MRPRSRRASGPRDSAYCKSGVIAPRPMLRTVEFATACAAVVTLWLLTAVPELHRIPDQAHREAERGFPPVAALGIAVALVLNPVRSTGRLYPVRSLLQPLNSCKVWGLSFGNWSFTTGKCRLRRRHTESCCWGVCIGCISIRVCRKQGKVDEGSTQRVRSAVTGPSESGGGKLPLWTNARSTIG